MHPELKALVAALDGQRASVLSKLAGLSEEDARRSTVPSGTNLAGLLQHLTFVESLWFEEVVAGGRVSRGRRSMDVDPAVTLRQLRADYKEACEASNAIVERVGDPSHPVTRNGSTHDLRWALINVLQEVSRHAGHADIIREQVDGRTGR